MAAFDPFAADAAAYDTAAPQASDFELGEFNIGEKNGAATYNYPIAVPEGRAGMAPSLNLSYSSQAPLRGGIAAGWELSLPSIELDTTDGTGGPRRFTANLNGAVGRLVETPDVKMRGGKTYRIENDDTFTIFEQYAPFDPQLPNPPPTGPIAFTSQAVTTSGSSMAGFFFGPSIGGEQEIYTEPSSTSSPAESLWLARTTNGITHYFVAGDRLTKWLLTSQVDASGNAISYNWERYAPGTGAIDYTLTSIEYGANGNAKLPAHAKVVFEYAPVEMVAGTRTPVGAHSTYRSGTLFHEGARRLTGIVTSVREQPTAAWRVAQRITLGYDAAALAGTYASPMRYLTSIATTAYAPNGTATTTAPITFQYGSDHRKWDQATTLPTSAPHHGRGGNLEGALLEIDGDGIADRVETRITRAGEGVLVWYRGLHGGRYSTIGQVTGLPTLLWRNGATRDPAESLNLAGQFTSRTNLSAASPGSRTTHLSYRFADVDGDGDHDLLTALYYDDEYYDPRREDNFNGPNPTVAQISGMTVGALSSDLFSGVASAGSITYAANPGGGGGGIPSPSEPYKPYNNTHAWWLFRNDDGVFAPMKIDAAGEYVNTVDVLRTYSRYTLNGTEGGQWVFELADQNGDGNLSAITWSSITGSTDNRVRQSWETGGTPSGYETKLAYRDINGDGLPDLLKASSAAGVADMTAYLNNGRGIDRLGRSMIESFNNGNSLESTGIVYEYGTRANRYQLTDVDGDGLSDLLDLRGTVAQVHYNVGGEFMPIARPLGSNVKRHSEQRYATTTNGWVQTTNYVDANGDGARDLVSWTNGSGRWTQTIVSQKIDGAPSRHLTKINNGVGGSIEFHYSSIVDARVVSRSGDDLPHLMWVVDTVTQVDALGPESTTHYAYAQPIYGSQSGDAGDPERFLGFQSVTKDLPQGGRVIRSFNYQIAHDARGRLASETTLIPKSVGGYTPVSKAEFFWVNEPIYGGQATFTHRNLERRWTYDANGVAQNESLLQSVETYLPWRDVAGSIVMYQLRGIDEFSGLTRGTDWKNTLNSYIVWNTAQRYQFELGHLTQKEPAPGYTSANPQFTILRDEYYRFNSQGLLTRVETVLSDGQLAVTVNEYDAVTGNLIATTKPQQFVTSGRAMRFAYDPMGLYVARENNELGHETVYQQDLATGALLLRQGPNFKLVSGNRVYEVETWRRDGLGRMLEHAVSIDDATLGYKLVPVEQATYVDRPAAGQPRRETIRQRLYFDKSIWTNTERRFDGWGRVIQSTEQSEWGPAVTRYQYAPGGDLSRIIAPRPGALDYRKSVIYLYDRDQLGRVVRFMQPSGAGLSITYSGLKTTLTELTANGTAGQKIERTDPMGRLVEVHELGGQSPAVTKYAYDALDRVKRIVDADGNVTAIGYDLAGNRTSLVRGGREWRYGYDRNGNLTSETTPFTKGENASDYTSTAAYDDLDRAIRRTPASLGMSDARMSELGIGAIAFTYDAAAMPNSIGQLSSVQLPFGQVLYAYNVQGLVTREERSFALSGLAEVADVQVATRTYNALGGELLVSHDGAQWRTSHDQRGDEKSIEWFDPTANAWRAVATYQRSASGHIVGQTNAYGQQRAMGFDVSGRLIRDRIFAGDSLLSERDYLYSDTGDLLAVTGQTGGASASSRYTYDGLHRLLAAEGPNGYEGAFSYSPAGNVLSARVGWNGSSQTRDVTYNYGAIDPQAVDALIDRQSGAEYASFEYNRAGALIYKSTPEGDWTFDYDAADMLREANGPNGRETYYYDHTGQRVLAIGEDEVRYWFGERETKYSTVGELKSMYHIPGAGGTVARATQEGKAPAEIEFQYSDTLQNLILSLDRAGEVKSSFLYGAFGEVVVSIGAEDHTRRFNGKEDDAVTGLRYYGARNYDPLTLRWSTADPLYSFGPDLELSSPQRANRYAYSLNNPERFIDHAGLDPAELPSEIIYIQGEAPSDYEYFMWSLRNFFSEPMHVQSATATTGDSAKRSMEMPKPPFYDLPMEIVGRPRLQLRGQVTSRIVDVAEAVGELAKSAGHTRENETWKETLLKGPGPSLARLAYEAKEGAKMTPGLIWKGAKQVGNRVSDRVASWWPW